MAYQLSYGSYTHDEGEVRIEAITKEGLANPHGLIHAIRETWVMEGRLDLDSHTISELETAYGTDGRNLSFGDHSLNSNATINGTRVSELSWLHREKGEYSNFRHYRIVVEGDRAVSTHSLLSFSEAISFQGTGGMAWGFLTPLNGQPQAQQFTQFSTQFCFQQGQAVGNRAWPLPEAPRFPSQEHYEARQMSYTVPPDNSGQRITTWSYTFEAPGGVMNAAYPKVKSIN